MNRRIVLASRPSGWPSEENFRLESVEQKQDLAPGECRVRIVYLSVDPYMRGRMRDRASYAKPVGIGDLMEGGAAGIVVESRSSRFPEGSRVVGMMGWQEFAVMPDEQLSPAPTDQVSLSTAIGVLGMPGLTAYFGLLDITKPQAGETVFVSGAAGAVGSIVGQLAKLHGCRAVGSAGSDEKVRHLVDDLGFDAAFNYKTAESYKKALEETCPDGIDVYFDNVGGPLTDAVLPNLNLRSRISVCGQISQYNSESPELGPRPYWHFIIKRIRMEGFLVFDFQDRYAEGLQALTQLVLEGKLKYRETVVDGLENAPAAFIGMMRGDNIGKQVVRISAE